MNREDIPLKNVQIKVTDSEYELLRLLTLKPKRSIQEVGRELLLSALALRHDSQKAPESEWHNKMDAILLHGDPEDARTIKRILDLAFSQARPKPNVKRA